jgi:YD repeat-containing protein
MMRAATAPAAPKTVRLSANEYDFFGNLSKIACCDNTTGTFTCGKEGRNISATDRINRTIKMTDPNGSVRLLTDGTGAITDTYTYDAFGNLLDQTASTVSNYL